ncbi:MAG: hypothetical protein IPL26_28210 [Leptospiraceae bacterium]|nr:hypothetical protein [Leptospiraceae bacterium]
MINSKACGSKLRKAFKQGLEDTGKISVVYNCGSGDMALQFCRWKFFS